MVWKQSQEAKRRNITAVAKNLIDNKSLEMAIGLCNITRLAQHQRQTRLTSYNFIEAHLVRQYFPPILLQSKNHTWSRWTNYDQSTLTKHDSSIEEDRRKILSHYACFDEIVTLLTLTLSETDGVGWDDNNINIRRNVRRVGAIVL
ncbi:hypothetical protein TSUD_301840 [Trifolium subterraneum]|uniref:Uncharacterized protein n=1 Tax=Trifolium subterraneum TaxID=3900 RepID=A0A2Z6PJA7_TRISU|nr:hypothetical protein TSUD_301840 [Trifolium subterraneum]